MVQTTYGVKQSATPDAAFKAEDQGDGLVPIHYMEPGQHAALITKLTEAVTAMTAVAAAVALMQGDLSNKLTNVIAAIQGSGVPGGEGPPPPAGVELVPDWKADMVGDAYTGLAFADFTNANGNVQRERGNSLGGLTAFAGNTVQRNDLGAWVDGAETRFLYKRSAAPTAWLPNPDTGWAGTAGYPQAAPAGVGDARSPAPAIIGASNSLGDYSPAWAGSAFDGLTEVPAAGAKVIIVARYKHRKANSDGSFPGWRLRVTWAGGEDNVTVPRLDDWAYARDIRTQNGLDPFSSDKFDLIQHEMDPATGWITTVLRHTVQGAGLTVRHTINGDKAGAEIYLGRCDVYTALTERDNAPATALATVVWPKDTLTQAGAGAVQLNGAAEGYFMLEVQKASYEHVGEPGLVPFGASATGAAVIQFGATPLIRFKGPTAFEVQDANGWHEGVIGVGGCRGIVRFVFAWDAGGWKCWANNGRPATGNGALTRAGAVTLLNGVSARVRVIEGADSKPNDTDAASYSSITNRTFVRPMDALAPGNLTVKFSDDHEASTMQTIEAPAYPYANGDALAQAFKPSWLADPTKRWKTRTWFWTSTNYNFGQHSINGEPQAYVDERLGADADQPEVWTWANSCRRIKAFLYADLTAGQKARIQNDPNTGQPFKYVSGLVTTYNGDPSSQTGGFTQRWGLWSWRAHMACSDYKGSWPALWLYSEQDTSEMDVEEFYGLEPGALTTVLHAWADDNPGVMFGWNTTVVKSRAGFSWAKGFHAWEALWTPGATAGTSPGRYRKYVDGALAADQQTNLSFEARPKMILENVAVHPAHAAQNAAVFDAAVSAGDVWMDVDWTKVYQLPGL